MKAWYQSKTLWVNILTLLTAIFALPELQTLAPGSERFLLAGVAVLNVVLRLLTTQPIGTPDA